MMARRKRSAAEKAVRRWMIDKDVEPGDIVQELDVAPSAVTRFLSGDLTSARFVKYFVNKGCSRTHFDNGRVAA